MGRWCIVSLVGLGLAACVGAGSPSPPNLDLQHWVGHPVSEVVATWGPPSRVADAAAGGARYSWLATAYGERSQAANRSPTGRGDDRQALAQLRCRALLQTDAAGVVTSATWAGEECSRR